MIKTNYTSDMFLTEIFSSQNLDRLSEKYGDSFYLLNSNQFRENYKELKDSFVKLYKNFNIAYSYKTNYIPTFCRIVQELGGYAEVVSGMELELARRCEVPYDRIILNGPIKYKNEIEQVLIEGGIVNIDNASELPIISSIAQDYKNTVINIGIRCNFDIDDGSISHFGIDVETDEFVDLIKKLSSHSNVYLKSIHCHFANRSIEYWPARMKRMSEIYKKVRDIIGCYPAMIDLGGGIYGKMLEELRQQFSNYIPGYSEYAESVIKECKLPDGCMPEIVIEPGTAIVGDCMKYVCKVKAIKRIRGKAFAILSGSQKNISMGNLQPPIRVIESPHKRTNRVVEKNIDLVGYTCMETDILFRNYSGTLCEGDYIIFSNCGSYSVVFKPPFIRPNVPIIDIANGSDRLIKDKESGRDIFYGYKDLSVGY